MEISEKSNHKNIIMLIITVLLGWLGVHRFIGKKWKSGLLWFFTLGVFGIGWAYDVAMAVMHLINPASELEEGYKINKTISSIAAVIMAVIVALCAFFGSCNSDDKKVNEEETLSDTSVAAVLTTEASTIEAAPETMEKTTETKTTAPATTRQNETTTKAVTNTAVAQTATPTTKAPVAKTETPTKNNAVQETPQGRTVYVYPNHGKKYHYNSTCSSQGNKSTSISIDEAKAQGYTPCKRCAGG